MIFVLSGMVGYLYWQQTRMLQHLQSLAIVISTQLVPQHHHEPSHEEVEESEEEEDDRVSVKQEASEEESKEDVEKVEGPPATEEKKEEEKVDIDDLQDKTAGQLRDMLTKKGIPFGKRDSKPLLIQLLKATA